VNKSRRNNPCPCGSGKKYKNCCFKKDYDVVKAKKIPAEFTAGDGLKIPHMITSIDSLPTHNRNGLTPDISSEQIMDLCIDEIVKILRNERAGMMADLVDRAIYEIDIIPAFTYRQIGERMEKDGRFAIVNSQIVAMKGDDPLALMTERLKIF
jgi:hypothetical protein